MTKVFISYSHDSDTHRDFVRGLSDRLRADGVDCQIDQYINGFPAEGWQRWMEAQVAAADFVLLVCTPDYLQRFRGLETAGGRGVNFEGVVISQTLYAHYYRNSKFVPILPEDGDMANVPLPLKGFGVFRMMMEYEGLYRFLTNQAAVVAPELGERVVLGEKNLPPASPKYHLTKRSTPKEGGLVDDVVANLHIEDVGESRADSHFAGMTDTMKAAWIGGAFILTGAIIAGIFTLIDDSTTGDCSPIISGEVSGSITASCESGDKK